MVVIRDFQSGLYDVTCTVKCERHRSVRTYLCLDTWIHDRTAYGLKVDEKSADCASSVLLLLLMMMMMLCVANTSKNSTFMSNRLERSL